MIGAAGNLLGLPAVSLPSGFNEAGLPTRVQFTGRAYEENGVLAVVRSYQSRTDWHTQHPPELVAAT